MNPTRYVYSTRETRHYRFPTHVNDLVLDRAEATASEVFVVVLEPGEAPPLHIHPDTEQIFYIMEGTGVLQIGGPAPAQLPVHPGEVVRIPPNTLHSIRCNSSATLRYLSVDCFPGGRPADEPTWETHVANLCKNNGWDFDRVRGKR